MKDILRIAILLMFLLTVVMYLAKSSAKESKKRNEALKNNIVFEGLVTSFKASDNHAFGIIRLKLIHCNVKDFDNILPAGIYPYQVKDSIAELYCTVSIKRKIGDVVKVVSNNQIIYYNPATSKEIGNLYITTSPYDMDFMKKHTIFEK